ncbi:MAG TPA: pitrilysin family protein [Vicinamibacterales bacterium]|jgi:zinc protease
MTVAVPRGLSPVRTVLDEGSVLLVQETSMTPAVTINATIMAGGVYEPSSIPGLAYVTGRVLDRGTTTRTAAQIAEDLDDRGVSLRIATARHTIAVTCTCLSEDFDDVLRIVIDTIRNPVFPDGEVEKRRAETLNSLRQDEDNPAIRAVQVLFALLYGPSHPYGRPAKGTVESVERVTRADLVRYHTTRFRAPRLVLAVAGDVPASRALDRAALELGGWSGTDSEDPPLPAPPPHSSRSERTIAIQGKSQSDIAYGFIAIRRLDPRYYGYWVMNNILGQFGLGGRIADNIRERQGMAYYAYSTLDPSIGEGPLLIRAGVDPANVERAIAAIDLEAGTLGSEGPTREELAQSQQYLIGSIPRMLETNAGIASFLQSVEQFGLGLDYDRELPKHLRAVTLDEVRAAAAELLHPDRASVAVAGPPASAA